MGNGPAWVVIIFAMTTASACGLPHPVQTDSRVTLDGAAEATLADAVRDARVDHPAIDDLHDVLLDAPETIAVIDVPSVDMVDTVAPVDIVERVCPTINGCCTSTSMCGSAVCVDGTCRTDCGAPGQLCCATDLCGDRLMCVPDGASASRCAPCGGSGQFCCPVSTGTQCAAGLTCTNLGREYCLPAPHPNMIGGPCMPVPANFCPSLNNCQADPCGTTARCLATPSGGVCIACGSLGEMCCTGVAPGLPYQCPGDPGCANQQSADSICQPVP